MKLEKILTENHGLNPDKRAELHRGMRSYRTPEEDNHIRRVKEQLKHGDSGIRDHIRSGKISIEQIINAIKRSRCIPGKNRDFGHTYLKNIIGNAIRDVVSPDQIRSARRTFGLEK